MDVGNKRKKELLERRLEEYYLAESKILRSQSYSLGSRQLTRADLSTVQAKIKDLESALDVLETYGTMKRRMRRAVPMD